MFVNYVFCFSIVCLCLNVFSVSKNEATKPKIQFTLDKTKNCGLLNYFTSKFPTLKELVFTREKRFGAKRILY